MAKNLFNLLRKTRYALAIRIDTMRYNQEVDHESGPRQLIFTWTTVGLNSQKNTNRSYGSLYQSFVTNFLTETRSSISPKEVISDLAKRWMQQLTNKPTIPVLKHFYSSCPLTLRLQ
jgi:hypothetical protein